MRLIIGLMLGFFLLIIFIVSYLKNKDLFSPLCIFSLLTFLRYVPHIISKDYESLVSLNADNTFKLFIIETLAVFSVVFGYLFYKTRFYNSKRYVVVRKKDVQDIKEWQIILLYCVGIAGRIRIILLAGGLYAILQNRGLAYASLSDGTGFFSMLTGCSVIGAMMQLNLVINTKKEFGKCLKYYSRLLVLLLMIGIYCLTYLVFTSRSPILEYLMFIAFGINYLWKRIKLSSLMKPKIFISIVFVVLIIIVLPQFRNGQENVKIDFSNASEKFIDEFSYVGRDALVYEHFDFNNLWFGRSYTSLMTAFVPYAIYPSKPPVDDGVYLSNLAYGHEITPPVERSQLYIKYSIPFSTPSIMYANFGILGVVLGCFFVGMLYAKYYKIAIDTQDVMQIIVYQLIAYQLELSSLQIVQTLIPLIMCSLVYKMLVGSHLIKEYPDDLYSKSVNYE